MERYVWFTPLGGIGEEPLDLFSCRRFVVSTEDESGRLNKEIYYFTKDKRWIFHKNYYEQDMETGDPFHIVRNEECHPEDVAHVLLWNDIYDGRLPEELENFREYGDMSIYVDWKWHNSRKFAERAAVSKPNRPKWEETTLTLWYGNEVCKRFSKSAANQHRVLEAFQRQNWPQSIRNPLDTWEQLKATVKDMNGWSKTHIIFQQGDRKVTWRPVSSVAQALPELL